MSDAKTPSTTEGLIHALYHHAHEHQEMLLLLSTSYLALLATARQKIDGFEECYKKHLEFQEASSGAQAFQSRLAAMSQVLSLIRDALGIDPDGTPRL